MTERERFKCSVAVIHSASQQLSEAAFKMLDLNREEAAPVVLIAEMEKALQLQLAIVDQLAIAIRAAGNIGGVSCPTVQ